MRVTLTAPALPVQAQVSFYLLHSDPPLPPPFLLASSLLKCFSWAGTEIV